MKYLVRNNRPRRILTIFGKILTADVPTLGTAAGEMWLTEDQFSHHRVQRLLEMGRLVLVSSDSEPEPAAPAPEPAPEPEPAPTPEPEVEEEPESEEDGAAVVQADGDIVPEADADEEGTYIYTEDGLSALTLPFIRPIAKRMGIEPTGKKAAIIAAILEAQG